MSWEWEGDEEREDVEDGKVNREEDVVGMNSDVEIKDDVWIERRWGDSVLERVEDAGSMEVVVIVVLEEEKVLVSLAKFDSSELNGVVVVMALFVVLVVVLVVVVVVDEEVEVVIVEVDLWFLREEDFLRRLLRYFLVE